MLAHWRELSPDLRLIYWSTALAGLGHSAYDGLLAPFLREEGLAVEGVGLFYSAITAVGAAASLAGGILADRVGARPV
ncbi:MAG TPA: MFS transporter, partial [Clostridiales bacterium]|nr:MFS transporter [Clostridiales bacterium]